MHTISGHPPTIIYLIALGGSCCLSASKRFDLESLRERGGGMMHGLGQGGMEQRERRRGDITQTRPMHAVRMPACILPR